ncbi:MAG: hydantoinase/oxoprolinase family protein [Candidatus Humimicrobiaceae bacterium]
MSFIFGCNWSYHTSYLYKDNKAIGGKLLSIGIDVGGTFTDFVVYDSNKNKVKAFKVLSNKTHSWDPVIQGLREINSSGKIRDIRHGTTVGTNAIIERKGSKTALITTKGFRDLLEIGRQKRPELYNLRGRKPESLISRDWRLEVEERVDAGGKVIIPLNANDLGAAIGKIKQGGIESVAVLFLHSYANNNHEKKAAKIIKDKFPSAYLAVSSELIPEFREYERLTTTVLNAYLGPVLISC